MGIDITRQPLSIVMVQFFLLSMLFLCRVEMFPALGEVADVLSGFALGGFVDRWVVSLNVYGHLLTMCIVFMNAMLITRVVTRNMILGLRTYIPSLIYLMLSAGLLINSEMSGYLVSTLIIHGSYYLIRGFRRAYSFDFIFRGSLFFGLSVLLCFEMVLMIVSIVIALILFKRSAREMVVAFVGFLLPLLTCSYVYWGMGYDFNYVCVWGWQSLGFLQNYSLAISAISLPQLVFVSLLILIIFLAIGAFIVNIRNIRNRACRIFIYFIWLLLIGGLLFALPISSTIGYSILAIPIAVIAPYYFVRHTNRVSTILYSALFASIVLVNILPFLV